MPLGTEVGLGPGEIMLDGDPGSSSPPPEGAQQPSTFRRPFIQDDTGEPVAEENIH